MGFRLVVLLLLVDAAVVFGFTFWIELDVGLGQCVHVRRWFDAGVLLAGSRGICK